MYYSWSSVQNQRASRRLGSRQSRLPSALGISPLTLYEGLEDGCLPFKQPHTEFVGICHSTSSTQIWSPNLSWNGGFMFSLSACQSGCQGHCSSAFLLVSLGALGATLQGVLKAIIVLSQRAEVLFSFSLQLFGYLLPAALCTHQLRGISCLPTHCQTYPQNQPFTKGT